MSRLQMEIGHSQLPLVQQSGSCVKDFEGIRPVRQQCLSQGANTEWISQQFDQPPIKKATKPRGRNPRFRAELNDIK